MSIFICPNCGKQLYKNNNSLICDNKHCFDISKEGYVNLLPINSKKSKNPGDNDKMIKARRMFLETGFYRPLANKIVSLIEQTLNNKSNPVIFDLGCGEGYYTDLVSHNLSKSFDLYALDISKIAVRYASKRCKNVSFCVASAFDIPVADSSIDLLYRIYAPSDKKELDRVIKKGGYLVTVTPGEKHLIELRRIIYNEVLNLSSNLDESESFKKISEEKLEYIMKIDEKQTVGNLLDMTPFGWKIKSDSLDELMKQTVWTICCDFNINIYQKII